MKAPQLILNFLIIFFVSFIVSSIVSFLYNLLLHSVPDWEWGTSFRFAIVLGIVITWVNNRRKS